MSGDDVTVRLDQLRGRQGRPVPPRPPAPPEDKKASDGGSVSRRLPRWALPVAIAVGLLFVLLLPLLFYSQPGFTIVVRGAPPNAQIFVDDVRRGIPGIEKDGDNVAGLVRIHGLKSNVSHPVRVNCGGGNAVLSLDGTAGITEVPNSQDGDVKEVTVKNCAPPVEVKPKRSEEVDYKGKMRLIARGEFLMGDDQGEPNERPAHVVNIDYDYYIDKYEVTNQQYREFSNSPRGRTFPGEPNWDRSYSSRMDHPVAGVSWEDAKAYCEEWAGKRLPTEAEWEKAASWDPNAADTTARSKRYWPWGNAFNPNYANFNSGRAKAVGQFAAGVSAYGVYDLAGNIGEWVNDSYQPYPNNAIPDPNYGGSYRVLRGGTFKLGVSKDALRTTRRFFNTPTFGQEERSGTAFLIGFRCAINSNDPKLQEQLGNAVR